MKKFTPVFKKDGQKIALLHPSFWGDNKQEAEDISLGCMIVDNIILGLEKTEEIIEIYDGMPYDSGIIHGDGLKQPLECMVLED